MNIKHVIVSNYFARSVGQTEFSNFNLIQCLTSFTSN